MLSQPALIDIFSGCNLIALKPASIIGVTEAPYICVETSDENAGYLEFKRRQRAQSILAK